LAGVRFSRPLELRLAQAKIRKMSEWLYQQAERPGHASASSVPPERFWENLETTNRSSCSADFNLQPVKLLQRPLNIIPAALEQNFNSGESCGQTPPVFSQEMLENTRY
jgi:hypothetical protein